MSGPKASFGRREERRRRARWGRFRRWGLGAAALGLPFAVLPSDQAKAQALPTGGNVVGGSGTISQTSANQLTINQNSATLSIDWQSFSVGAGNIVRFIQPDSSSLALNRVIGPDPSMIFGSIQANGRVVIMNPAGIYFGPSSMVDVNGLVATTSRMNQADFLAGNLNFSLAGDVNARVINEGFVNVAQGGFAVLSAAAVENKGTIVAQGGTVVLAGTPTFTLDFFGDGLLKFASTGTVTQAPTGANALVDNSGTIHADGGRVLMTARAARDVINNVINVTGIVEARSARIENGEIVIDGGEFGNTVVAGRLDVSGTEADAKGGNVTVLGGNVQLAAGTDIRASGEAGGGTVLVGGGQRGQGTDYNAQTLYMDAAAVIEANATLNGDGGKVVLWADDTARVEGSISARGGSQSGDGGFVETSGKNRISFADTVSVDTRAINGRDGMLLIDPNDFTIASSGGDITAAVLLGMLVSSDITIDSATGGSGTLGNINVDDAILYAGVSTRTLTLNAMGSININAGISASIINLNLVLQAAGNVNIGATINTNNGYLRTEGRDGVGALGGNFTTTASISLSNAALTLNTAGTISLGGTVTTNGTVTLNAGGAVTQTYGIVGASNLVLGGTGAITLNDPGNSFSNITLNRTGTTTNVSLVTSITPTLQASTLGTGSFYLGGVGFTQSGAIVQDALADSATIQGNGGIVTLSQANIWTGDVTVLGGTINVTNDQSFNIDSSAILNLLSNGNISVSRNLVATGPGSMSMIFNTRYSGGSYGYIDIRPTTYDISIDTNGGYIVMGGGSSGLTNALPSLTQAAIGGGGIDQGISIRGYDNSGTPIGVTIDTGGGNFFARGVGAAGGTVPTGVALDSTAGGAWVTITTGAGNINIHGTGGTGSYGDGVLLRGNSAIETAKLQTTSGNITVTGISGPGGDSNGIYAANYSEILTASGMLTLSGTSTGTGYSRGVLSEGVIDAGTAGGSTITGMSLNEYGVRLGPTTDWRVGNGGTLSVMGTGTSGVGIDGSAFTLDDGSLIVTGEGTSGQGINLSGAITYDGAYGLLQFNGVGAYGDIVLSGTIDSTGTVDLRTLELQSSGNIDLQGTPAATVINATPSGALVVLAQAAGTLDLGGKIVTEGGAVSLIGGKTVAITAGIETFGGDIHIWGNAPSGDISGTSFAGAGSGVIINQTSATPVVIDAGGANIDIAGVAGDTGGYNIGVLINGGQVQTTGAGAISIKGQGGAASGGGDGFQVGVYINGSTFFGGGTYATGTMVSAGTGGLTITGNGGTAATDGSNFGVVVATSSVMSSGFLNIEATGGSGPGSDSILFAAGSATSTGANYDDILLTGHAPVGTGYGIVFADGFSNDGNSVTIGGNAFQGSLFIRTDSLQSTTSSLSLSHQPSGGTIQFETLTPSLGIGVNGGDAGGGIAVTAGILASVSGFETLRFGNGSMTGAIQMDSTAFGSFAGLSSITSFEVQTQGVFYSNTLDFNGKAATINAGGASGGTLTNFDILTLTGAGDFIGIANGGTLIIDKTGTSADVDVSSASTLTLGTSTMGSGTLALSGLAITQIGALVQDAIGGNVMMNSSGVIVLGQSNTFSGSLIMIEGGSIQITAEQTFARGDSQTVNLVSTAGNVMVAGDLIKSGSGGANFNIDAWETAWFANASVQSDGGNITVWGNAPGSDNNAGTNVGAAWGVRIDGANAALTSGAGNIEIIGKGSQDNATGQHGIVLINGGKVITDSGYIIMGGRGGDGTGAGAQGIILSPGSVVSSQSGYIELYGYGGANSTGGHGIAMDVGASITNVSGAYIVLSGQGFNGGTGIVANGSNTIDAGTGQIGMASNNGISLDGVALTALGGANFDGGTGDIALNNANNLIAGTVGFTTTGNASFVNAGVDAITMGTTSVGGYLAVATGGDIDQGASPIHVTGASNFTAGGAIVLTNSDNTFGGAVTLTNDGSGNNIAIFATGALTLDTITTQGTFTAQASGSLTLSGASTFAEAQDVTLLSEGAISITATQTLNGGTFTADGDTGVTLTAGISTSGGNINLYGNAPGGGAFGSSSSSNYGVFFNGASAVADAGGGNIFIKGAGGDTGAHGVSFHNGAGARTSGTGTLTIEGRGGDGGSGAVGVEFYAGGSFAEVEHGALIVTGTGGSVGYGNAGVALATGEIRAIGGGSVTVTGTGGGSGSMGVHVGGGGTTMISAVDGTITINATGGGANDSGSISWGLSVAGDPAHIGLITTSGAGDIVINATAGGMSGDNDRYGMIVGPGGSVITQFAGISITAIGGMGGGTGNYGLYLDGGHLTTLGATGGITVLADSLAAVSSAGISSQGTVTIAPQTGGLGIGIGGGSGGMQLGSSFSYISAGTLKIGNASTGIVNIGAGGLNAPPATALYLQGAEFQLTGDINAMGGKLTLHATSAGVTQSAGIVTANTLILRGNGNFTLDSGGADYNSVEYVAADVSGTLALNTTSASTYTDATIATDTTGTVTGITANGNFNWASLGSIGQSTGALVSVTGPVNLTANGSITFYEGGNNFLGPVTASNSAGSISLRAGQLAVGASGISSAGDLILGATTGALQQSGGVLAGGNFYASAADGIMLSNSSNAVAGSVSLTTTGGTNATWIENGTASLGSSSVSGNLSVSVTSGSISQVGALSVTGASNFTATGGDVTLTNAGNAFGGDLSLMVSSGSASITTAGSLSFGYSSIQNSLTVVAGGTLSQGAAPIMVTSGTTSLTSIGGMNLQYAGNNFGTALTLIGNGGDLGGTVNSQFGADAAPFVTAAGTGFTFAGVSIASSSHSSGGGNNEATTTTTVPTETLAQIITQILTSTVAPASSSNAPSDATTVNPVSPAAVQAMLIAILAEAASPAGGTGGGDQQSSGEGGGTQQAGGQAGAGAQSGTPSVTAETGTFGAGTTITINTSGGTVASITVTPVGGGAPVTIVPGLLNLASPAIPTATATGTPGISGNFPLAWGGR